MVDVVRQFFAALDKAAQTGNTDDLIAVTHPDCTCRKVVATIKAEFNGGHDVGARWAVQSVTFFAFDRGTALVHSVSTISAYKTVNSDGTVRASYPAGQRHDLVRLTYAGSRWRVLALSESDHG